jgi:hypothetical protein
MSNITCDQCQQSIVIKEGQYRVVGIAREGGGYGRVASVVNVYVHRACEAAWRAEAGYSGRVIEVIDVASEREAWDGIRAKLEVRCKPSR